jgi:hypothetical protein
MKTARQLKQLHVKLIYMDDSRAFLYAIREAHLQISQLPLLHLENCALYSTTPRVVPVDSGFFRGLQGPFVVF